MTDNCVKCGHQATIHASANWACSECGLVQRVPLTAVQRETERILANVADLPIGKTITLADIAHDGLGGMVIKRHSRSTVVFQRQFSRERSRWADELAEAYDEIMVYVMTGKLHEADRIVGF
jgi:hypothetical protein